MEKIINFEVAKDAISRNKSGYEYCVAVLETAISELENHKQLSGIENIILSLQSSISEIEPFDQDEIEQ